MFEGHFDRIRANVIDGWVWDNSTPNLPICVEITNEQQKLIAVGIADRYRADLHSAGKGNGAHGFSIKLAAEDLRNSRALTIRAMGHGYELVGSPVALNDEPYGINESLSAIASSSLLAHFEADRKIMLDYARVTQQLYDQLQKHKQTVEIALRSVSEEYGPLRISSEKHSHTEEIRLPDIVFFPPIDWDYRYQRPQQLAAGLGKLGHRVFYVAPTFGMASGYKIYGNPCPNVYLTQLGCDIPHPAINRESFTPKQALSLRSSFQKLQSNASLQSTIAVLQNPVWHSIISNSYRTSVVYDCLDFVMGFESSTESMAKVERKLIKEADLVVTTSSPLQQYVISEKPRQRPLLIRNACADVFFSVPPPKKLSGRRPVIGYIGALEHWFNTDLVAELSRKHRNWDFILAGNPTQTVKLALQNEPNIRLAGEIPIDEVPVLLSEFDVCIIPFKEDEIVRYTNPVKAYEYLAAGRAVVSTPMEELDQFHSFIKQANNIEKFSQCIREQLLFTNNRAAYIDRKLCVADETWTNRVNTFRSAINLLSSNT